MNDSKLQNDIIPKIWVLTDNSKANSEQAIALAQKISDNYEIKQISYNNFSKLSNWILKLFPLHVKHSVFLELERSTPPDIIISAGRKTASLSAYLKKLYKSQNILVKNIQILRPSIKPKYFDIIILPQHDCFNYVSPNIIKTIGSITNIKSHITEADYQFRQTYSALNKYIVLIIANDNRHYNIPLLEIEKLIISAEKLAQQNSMKLLVKIDSVLSKKAQSYMRKICSSPNIIYFNPENIAAYPAILKNAYHIIVTADSIYSCSEAVSSGTPVHIYIPQYLSSKKHKYFVQQLIDIGVARQFDLNINELESYPYIALNELSRVEKIIKNIIF
ncbi:MAG: mitochondrial fission ELM1 family protein [Rickettsiaceae bacterium]|nr:mitochondrial fission ELM1 family protein [Rickettsiaceae bacterium]